MDFVFGKSHHPGGDLDGALVAHHAEWPGQHVREVRIQRHGAAFHVDLFHWVIEAVRRSLRMPGAALWTSFSSASDRRNARVDSAPWFSLLRSICSPSEQPPVWGQ